MRTVSRGRQYLVTEDNALALQGFKWSLGIVSKQLARPQNALPACSRKLCCAMRFCQSR